MWSPDDTNNVSYIHITSEQLKDRSKYISPEALVCSPSLSSYQHSLLRYLFNLHDHMYHLTFCVMFKLCTSDRSPKKYLILQDRVLLYTYYSFGQAKRQRLYQG